MQRFAPAGLLAFGCLMSFAAPSAAADVTLYGRVDLDAEIQKGPKGSTAQETDNASRWGMRGTENLGNGMTAVFGLEQGFNADDGTAVTPQYRNAYVGLTGAFGAFALGRLDSATPVGSPIYSQITHITDFVIHDAGATAIGTKVLNARNRVSNAFGYQSPDFGGFSLRARMYFAGPETPPSNPAAQVRFESDWRAYDVGLNYDRGPFSAGLGYSKDDKRGGLVANDFNDKVQLAVGYNFTVVNTYAVIGRDRYAGTASTRSQVRYWLAGFTVPFGTAHQITANYMERDVQTDRAGKLKKFQIGYGYNLSKRTMPYVFFDREDPNSNVRGNRVTTYGAGIKHLF
ncbi:porin [Ralstonia sp. A12]|uniref:porin n=1 Tax=Ralstonia sp. A12 TaxID=1217052 RepID=UPI0005745C93|nr:porin [Ralstonia sp. A12]KHK50620.1 porin [Ralstonia sp. A12]